MSVSDFETTQWSIVLRAGQVADSQAGDALAYLCERYWYPLYAFVRKKGHSIEVAEDITQGFVAKLIEKRILEHALPQRGKFRTFLLTSLQNFLINEWKYSTAEKRGGKHQTISIDIQTGESKLDLQPADLWTPEKLFDRAWAVQLLEWVLERLRAEYATRSREQEFKILQPYLMGKTADHSYDAVAETLAISVDSVRQNVHRMRKRYRELLRLEVAQTVTSAEEVDDEIRNLFTMLQ